MGHPGPYSSLCSWDGSAGCLGPGLVPAALSSDAQLPGGSSPDVRFCEESEAEGVSPPTASPALPARGPIPDSPLASYGSRQFSLPRSSSRLWVTVPSARPAEGAQHCLAHRGLEWMNLRPQESAPKGLPVCPTPPPAEPQAPTGDSPSSWTRSSNMPDSSGRLRPCREACQSAEQRPVTRDRQSLSHASPLRGGSRVMMGCLLSQSFLPAVGGPRAVLQDSSPLNRADSAT